MSIRSGTHTFGSGGTYPFLSSITADLQFPLLGDTTLVMVGNSDEPGTIINRHLISLGGFTLKFTSATPHDMRPNRGHFARYGRFSCDEVQSGTLTFDDFYGISTVDWSFRGEATDGTPRVNFNFLNSMFKSAGIPARGFYAPFGNNISSDGTHFIKNKISNCKFWGCDPLWLFTAFPSDWIQHQIENIVVYASSGTYAVDSSQEGWQTGFPPRHFMAGSVVRNVLALVANTGTMSAWKRAANPPYVSEFGAITSYSARNGGIDSGSFFLYPNESLASAIISTDEANDGFLELKHDSPLFGGGGATVIAANPYTSAPWPIGIWHTIQPVRDVLPGQNLNLRVPIAAGRGVMSPPYSRILPSSTGKIAHAKILRTYRDAERASAFHSLMKGL